MHDPLFGGAAAGPQPPSSPSARLHQRPSPTAVVSGNSPTRFSNPRELPSPTVCFAACVCVCVCMHVRFFEYVCVWLRECMYACCLKVVMYVVVMNVVISVYVVMHVKASIFFRNLSMTVHAIERRMH